MDNEIGTTLESLLKKFLDSDVLYMEELISDTMPEPQELLFALWKRGFIAVAGHNSVRFQSASDIQLSEPFRTMSPSPWRSLPPSSRR